MIESARRLPGAAGLIALLLAGTATEALGQNGKFDVANVFFELNDTDEDLGLHALIDAEAWRRVVLRSPRGKQMLKIDVRSELRSQGLTELFFESAEPELGDGPDQLDPDEFFRRFPVGRYRITGITLDGEVLSSRTRLTHAIPAAPDNIMVNDEALDEDCDDETTPAVSEPVTISWDEVTTRHDELGRNPGGGNIEIVRYQVVVEFEDEDENTFIYSVDLPPDVTSIDVPEDFTALTDELKYEILVREASGNQTAVESCFEIDEG